MEGDGPDGAASPVVVIGLWEQHRRALVAASWLSGVRALATAETRLRLEPIGADPAPFVAPVECGVSSRAQAPAPGLHQPELAAFEFPTDDAWKRPAAPPPPPVVVERPRSLSSGGGVHRGSRVIAAAHPSASLDAADSIIAAMDGERMRMVTSALDGLGRGL